MRSRFVFRFLLTESAFMARLPVPSMAWESAATTVLGT
jgi:hypothetical protein